MFMGKQLTHGNGMGNNDSQDLAMDLEPRESHCYLLAYRYDADLSSSARRLEANLKGETMMTMAACVSPLYHFFVAPQNSEVQMIPICS